MIPYYMREGQESRKNTLEVGAAVAGMILLSLCAIADVPRASPDQRAPGRPEAQRPFGSGALRAGGRPATPVVPRNEPGPGGPALAELQTATQQLQARNSAVETEMAALTRLLQGVRAELAGLKEGHNALAGQVTTTVAKLQQLETTVQETSARLARSVDPKVLLQVTKERDEALAQTKQSDDQVRQLTLKLQRAGLFP